MQNTFTHGLGLVFYFFLLWLFARLSLAAWGSERVPPKWRALAATPFMRRIGIRWLGPLLALAVAAQIALVIFMLGYSAWSGRPITFDQAYSDYTVAPAFEPGPIARLSRW